MAVIAGFLVQNALKYLLKFGTVSNYVGYNALEDFFPNEQIRPNPNCDDRFCRQRQNEYQERLANEPAKEKIFEEEAPIVHEENDWGIELCDSLEEIPEENSTVSAGKGLKYAYDAPSTNIDQTNGDEPAPKTDASVISNLMAQFQSAQNL
jgi:ubiquitin-like modifier-activating enzyme 5